MPTPVTGQIRVGLIGAGLIGQLHSMMLRYVADRTEQSVRVVSVADVSHSAAESLALVQVQYKSGAASYVQVLSAEQSYQTAAVALVKARAQRYADTAALFQALGGGWWNRNDVAANSIE